MRSFTTLLLLLCLTATPARAFLPSGPVSFSTPEVEIVTGTRCTCPKTSLARKPARAVVAVPRKTGKALRGTWPSRARGDVR